MHWTLLCTTRACHVDLQSTQTDMPRDACSSVRIHQGPNTLPTPFSIVQLGKPAAEHCSVPLMRNQGREALWPLARE